MPKAKPTTNSVVEIKRYPSTLIHKHKSEDRDEYKGRNFLELMNYDVVFKPKPALVSYQVKSLSFINPVNRRYFSKDKMIPTDMNHVLW